MKIKEGFMLRHVGDQIVVVALGEASKDFNGIIRLNETGEFLWNKMTHSIGKKQLVAALMEEYPVNEATASRDVTAFVMKLKEAHLLEE